MKSFTLHTPFLWERMLYPERGPTPQRRDAGDRRAPTEEGGASQQGGGASQDAGEGEQDQAPRAREEIAHLETSPREIT